MTVINPNSISGIASVTAQGDIIQFYKSDGTLGAVQFDGANFNTTSGVSTFKNLYVGGTLTYEDVKNVDSVGIVTARDGIKVTGGTLNVTNSENTLGILSSTDDGANLDLWDNDTQSRIRTVGGQLQLRADVGNDVADSSIRFFVDGANEKLRITNDGKVGIGSLIPADTLDVHGNARFGAQSTADAQVQIGRGGSGNRNAYLDLVGDNTYTDYGFRIIRKNGGANTESQITHRGTGDFTINTNEAAALRFSTTSTERLRIESSGRVGINTTSARVNGLHIYDKHLAVTEGYPLTWLQPNSTSSRGRMTVDSGGNYLFQFGSGNDEKIRFKSNGAVGIGTNDPGSLLHLQSADARLRWTDSDGAADNKHWDLGSTSANLLRLQAKSDAGGGGGNLFDFYRSGNQINEFRGMKAGAYWFIIDNNNQRVGIGTDDPTGQFHVHKASTSVTQVLECSSGAASLQVRHTNGYGTVNFWASGTEKWRVGQTGTSSNFNIWDVPNSKARFSINTSGQIGIGQDFLPSRQLDVKDSTGANRIMNIRGTGSSGAFLAFLDANTTDDSKVRIGEKGGNKLSLRGDEHHFEKGDGTSRMVIDSTGLVGINETNPVAKLHIDGSGEVPCLVLPDSTNSRYSVGFGNINVSGVGQRLDFYAGDSGNNNNNLTNAARHMSLTSQGRLGIGTITPHGPLTVTSDNADAILIKATSTGQYASARIHLQSAPGAANDNVTALVHGNDNAGGTQSYFAIESKNSSHSYKKTLALYKHSDDYWAFHTGSGDTTSHERLKITSGGTIETKGYQGQCFKFNSDFGIGARNVQIWNAANGNWHSFVGTNLTWDGTNYIKPSDNASSNWGNIAGMVFEGSNANNSSGNHPAIRFLVDQPAGNSANFSLGSSKTNAIDQKTAACITSSGNFGIGTENPGSSLVVEGTIIANNGTLQVDKHIVDGTDDWAGASYILHNKRSFTNGSWTNYFKFDRSDTAADNNDCGVFAGHLHIVYMNDRSNSVHTTGYDVFPFIVRGRSNNTVSGNFGSAVVDLHEVIGSSVEVRFDSATASVIYIQIKIYNSDAGGSERLCHAWIDGGGVANLSNRFLYPEITT